MCVSVCVCVCMCLMYSTTWHCMCILTPYCCTALSAAEFLTPYCYRLSLSHPTVSHTLLLQADSLTPYCFSHPTVAQRSPRLSHGSSVNVSRPKKSDLQRRGDVVKRLIVLLRYDRYVKRNPSI